MITQTKRNAIRQRIHARIRAKLSGTGERPRLNVYRSLNHIYAQVIDDQKGETMVSASTIATLPPVFTLKAIVDAETRVSPFWNCLEGEDRRQRGRGQRDRQGSGPEGCRKGHQEGGLRSRRL